MNDTGTIECTHIKTMNLISTCHHIQNLTQNRLRLKCKKYKTYNYLICRRKQEIWGAFSYAKIALVSHSKVWPIKENTYTLDFINTENCCFHWDNFKMTT